MKKIRENNGITLIAVMLTVVLLAILCGIVVSSGINSNVLMQNTESAVGIANAQQSYVDDIFDSEMENFPDATNTIYTITYHLNGGTAGFSLVQQKRYGEAVLVYSEIPTKEWNTFRGWSLVEGSSQVTYVAGANITANTNKNLNLYAVWDEIPTYTIIFADGDGNTLQTKILHQGETPTYTAGITPTKAPTAQHTYSYNSGWSPAISAASKNQTYTATFDTTVRKYTITWDNQGTTTTEDYEYGVMPTYKGQTPTKTGEGADYTFSGWSPTLATVTGAKTYTAQFTSVPWTYLVTFYDENGTTVLGTKTVDYNQTAVYPNATPTKEEDNTYTYTFDNWYTARTGGTVDNLTNVKSNKSVYARYTNTYREYTVTFYDENGTTVLGTKTVHYQETATYPNTTPTKASDNTYTYTFDNWYTAKTGGSVDNLANVTADRSAYARYTNTYKNYTVAFKNWDGTTLASNTYHYNATVTVPANLTRSATEQYTYAFSGWTPTLSNTCTGDATYTANYTETLNTYTVTYNINGGTGTTPVQQTKTYGVDLTLSNGQGLTNETKTLIGWATTSNATTADYTLGSTYAMNSNITLYAVWIEGLYGLGTEASPFLISSANDLCYMRDKVNISNGKIRSLTTGDSTYVANTSYYKLTQDIDLSTVCGETGFTSVGLYDGVSTSAKNWVSIGKVGSGGFKGYFYGNNKIITGLYYNGTGNNSGLFATIGVEGRVYNINIINVNIVNTRMTGGIAGVNYGVIDNCTVNGNINCTETGGGGIVGSNSNGNITNCINNATVSSTSYRIGGIAGSSYKGNITNCINYGAVNGNLVSTTNNSSESVGGIVGDGGGDFISNCSNFGTITSTECHTGGIIGNSGTDSIIIDCYNSGNISVSQTIYAYVGGITSQMWGNTKTAKIYNCYNSGNISYSGEVSGWSNHIGGILGTRVLDVEVYNCYNIGKVSSTSPNNRGIIIGDSGGGVENCYYLPVTGENVATNAAGSGTLVDTYAFDTNCTLASSVTIGSTTTTDLTEALNAWVNENQETYLDNNFEGWARENTNAGTYPKFATAVKYYAYDGIVTPKMTLIPQGTNVTLPTSTASTAGTSGGTFLNWSEGVNTYNAGSSYTTTESTILVAKFRVTLTYNVGAGTVSPTSETGVCGEFVFNTTPTQSGKTFLGWDTDPSADEVVYKIGDIYKSSTNRILYAVWVDRYYTVSYNSNTTDTVSNMPSNQTKEWDVNLTLSANIPTRTGYTFIGWTETSTQQAGDYGTSGTYTKNESITLYAVWEQAIAYPTLADVTITSSDSSGTVGFTISNIPEGWDVYWVEKYYVDNNNVYWNGPASEGFQNTISYFGTEIVIKFVNIEDNTIESDLIYTEIYARGCFVENTKVYTEKGLINIQDIKVGDVVYTKNLENGQIELKTVLNTFVRNVSLNTCKVYVGDEYIHSTDGHEYYEKEKGWIGAKELLPGDIIISADGTEKKVEKVELIETKDYVTVYNFEVQDNHNYFVGEEKVLVHNAGDPC